MRCKGVDAHLGPNAASEAAEGAYGLGATEATDGGRDRNGGLRTGGAGGGVRGGMGEWMELELRGGESCWGGEGSRWGGEGSRWGSEEALWGGNETRGAGEETRGGGKETRGGGKDTRGAGEEARGAGEDTRGAGEEIRGGGKETRGDEGGKGRGGRGGGAAGCVQLSYRLCTTHSATLPVRAVTTLARSRLSLRYAARGAAVASARAGHAAGRGSRHSKGRTANGINTLQNMIPPQQKLWWRACHAGACHAFVRHNFSGSYSTSDTPPLSACTRPVLLYGRRTRLT